MEKKLQRIPFEGALAGVCAGISEYLQIDKAWVRVFFVLTVLFSSAFGIGLFGPVIYIVLWIVLPVKSVFEKTYDYKKTSGYQVDYRVNPTENQQEVHINETSVGTDPIFDTSFSATYPEFEFQKKKKNRDRQTIGAVLLFIGLVFFLFQFDIIYWTDLRKFWPLILIVIGFLMVVNSYTSLPEKSGDLDSENVKLDSDDAVFQTNHDNTMDSHGNPDKTL